MKHPKYLHDTYTWDGFERYQAAFREHPTIQRRTFFLLDL
jgi:hypothetical protein